MALTGIITLPLANHDPHLQPPSPQWKTKINSNKSLRFAPCQVVVGETFSGCLGDFLHSHHGSKSISTGFG